MTTLVPIDDDFAASLAAGASFFEARLSVRLGVAHGWVHDAVRRSRESDRYLSRTAPWLGRIALDAERRAVGTCGFANTPATDGFAEIWYETFAAFERRGHGKAMAGALLGIARQAGMRRLVAHTSSCDGTSARILEGWGFRNDGECSHRDAGRVWKWRVELPASADDRDGP